MLEAPLPPHPRQKNPWVGVVLSLVPGLGQLYVGKTKKGVALLVIDASMVISHFFFPSRITWFLTGVIYFAAVFTSSIESYQFVKTGLTSSKLNSKLYVVLMLLGTGFSALPLLWQNSRFSKHTKILWTIAVPILALFFFWFLRRGAGAPHK